MCGLPFILLLRDLSLYILQQNWLPFLASRSSLPFVFLRAPSKPCHVTILPVFWSLTLLSLFPNSHSATASDTCGSPLLCNTCFILHFFLLFSPSFFSFVFCFGVKNLSLHLYLYAQLVSFLTRKYKQDTDNTSTWSMHLTPSLNKEQTYYLLTHFS